MARNPSVEIQVNFEKKKVVEDKLKKLIDDVQKSTKGIKIKIDDTELKSQLDKIEKATKNLAEKSSSNLNKINLGTMKKETEEFKNSMEGLALASSSMTKTLGSGISTHSSTYKNNLEESLRITNVIDEKSKKILSTNIKSADNYEKLAKNLASLEKSKLGLQSKVDKLYSNDLVPKENLVALDNIIDGLSLDSTVKDLEKVNLEIRKLSDLEKQLKSQNAKQRNDTIDVFNKQKEIELTRELIELEKKKLNTTVKKMEVDRGSLLDGQAARVNEVKKAINNLNGQNTKEVRAEVKKLNAEITDINTVAKSLGKNTGNKDRMSLFDGFKSFATKSGIALSLYEVVNVVRSAISHVVELDTAMIELKKVTDATSQTYDDFVLKMHNVSMALGTQTTEMVKMASEWARTGKTLQESAKLAESSALLLKVGDSKDTGSVMNHMIAPLTAFNIQAEKSIDLVDKYNKLSNNMATDTNEIGEGLARSASALKTAGNDLNQSMALISVAESKTKLGGESVGNALKTISLRLATFKDDETGESLLTLADDFKKVGVEMYGLDGQIRSTYDLMLDLSKVFNSLDRNTQLSLSEKIGGKRQANYVAAILSDTKELERALSLAQNASGSAIQEHDKYTESIKYSLDRAIESIQNLYRTIVSSDTLKFLVDSFTSVVNIVTVFVDNLGVLNTAILGVITYMAIFNKSFASSTFINSIPFVQKLTSSFNNLTTSVKADTVAKEANTFKTASMSAVTQTATLSQKAMTIATVALKTALIGGLAIAITTVIGGLVKWADQAITTQKELRKLNQESTQMVQDTTSSIAKAESTYQKIGELQSKINDTKDINERNRLTKELTDLQAELSGILPETASGFDSEGRAISVSNELIKEQINLKKQSLLIEASKFADNNKNIKGELEGYQRIKDEVEKLTLAKMKGEKITEKGKALVSGQWIDKEYTKEVDSKYLESLQSNLEETNRKIAQTSLMIETLRSGGKTDSEIKAMGLPVDEIEEFNNKLKEAQLQTDKLNKKLDEKTPANALKDATKAYGEAIDKAGEFNSLLEKVNKEQRLTPEIISELAKKYPELGASITNLSDVQTFLNSKIDEQVSLQQRAYEQMVQYDENYYNSKIKNNQQLSNEISNFLNQFTEEGAEAYKIDYDNYTNLHELKADVMNKSSVGLVKWIGTYVNSNMQGYKTDYSNFENLVNAKMSLMEQFSAIAAVAMGDAFGSVFSTIGQTLGKIQSAMPNFSQYVPSFGGFGSGDFSSGSGGGKDKAEKEYQPVIDKYYEISNLLDDINDKLSMNRKLQETAKGQDKIKLQREELELLKQQADMQNRLTNQKIAEANRLKGELAKKGATFDSNGNITNYNKLLDGTGDKIKALEELIKEYTKLTQDEIPKCNEEWQDLQNQIKEVNEEMAKQVADTEKQIFDTIKHFAEKATEEKKKQIDKQIDLLNKQRDEEDKADDKADKQNKLNDLKAEIDKLSLASDEKSKALLKQLQDEYAQLQKEFNKDIRDSILDSNIEAMEKEKTELDKALEDFLDPANINKVIQDALTNGYVQIGDEVVNLQDLTKKYLQETEIGIQNTNQRMDEYINKLKEAQQLVARIDEINKNAGIQQQSLNNQRVIPNNAQATNNVTTNNFTVEIKVEGNATPETAQNIGKVIDNKLKEFAKKFK